jgi:hypothetical protein
LFSFNKSDADSVVREKGIRVKKGKRNVAVLSPATKAIPAASVRKKGRSEDKTWSGSIAPSSGGKTKLGTDRLLPQQEGR